MLQILLGWFSVTRITSNEVRLTKKGKTREKQLQYTINLRDSLTFFASPQRQNKQEQLVSDSAKFLTPNVWRNA